MILIELDPESLLSRLIFGNVFEQLDCGPMQAAECCHGSATEGMKLKLVRLGSYTPCQSACMTGTTERWLGDDVHDNTRQPTLTARRGATGQRVEDGSSTEFGSAGASPSQGAVVKTMIPRLGGSHALPS